MERALLIEWNRTGKRAGNINPKDPKLPCYGGRAWQNMDVEPHLELRLVEDDRDLSRYQGIKGITIIEGREAIDATIDQYFPESDEYEIELENILIADMQERGRNISELAGKNKMEAAKWAFNNGFAGVTKRSIKPPKMADIILE